MLCAWFSFPSPCRATRCGVSVGLEFVGLRPPLHSTLCVCVWVCVFVNVFFLSKSIILYKESNPKIKKLSDLADLARRVATRRANSAELARQHCRVGAPSRDSARLVCRVGAPSRDLARANVVPQLARRQVRSWRANSAHLARQLCTLGAPTLQTWRAKSRLGASQLATWRAPSREINQTVNCQLSTVNELSTNSQPPVNQLSTKCLPTSEPHVN